MHRRRNALLAANEPYLTAWSWWTSPRTATAFQHSPGVERFEPGRRQGERVAVHFRKNEAAYSKEWDHEMPDRIRAESWAKYVEAMEQDKIWVMASVHIKGPDVGQ